MSKIVFPRDFYIPKGSVKITDKTSDAVAYLYSKENTLGAVMFGGKAQKPSQHFIFRTVERRDAAVKTFFEGRRSHAAYVAKQRAERSKPHTLVVGDILVSSWGYEQTNIDFYQVTAVTPGTVKVRGLKQDRTSTGWERGTCMPIRDAFVGPETTHRANSTNSIRTASYASASKWDGKAENWTSYH